MLQPGKAALRVVRWMDNGLGCLSGRVPRHKLAATSEFRSAMLVLGIVRGVWEALAQAAGICRSPSVMGAFGRVRMGANNLRHGFKLSCYTLIIVLISCHFLASYTSASYDKVTGDRPGG